MPASTTKPTANDSSELGARVVHSALALSAVAAPVAALILTTQALLNNSFSTTTLFLSLYALTFPVLWACGRNRNNQLVGSLLIGLLLVMTFLVQIRSGPYTSQAPLQLMTLILGGLIFGKRGVYTVLAINLCLFALAGALLLNAVVPGGAALYYNPNSAAVWIRSAAIMTLFGGCSAWAVVYTIEKLHEETTKLRATLAREHAQMENLARAEKERQDAVKAVAEAQRIEVLGRLASGVAHDFNNSLTVIMASTEMAQLEPNLSPRAVHLLESIKKASLQAAAMTRSLLALGRKDPARYTVVTTDTVLLDLYEPITRLLPADIKFTIAETCDAKILVDRVQLERALLNLVLNAKDAVGAAGEITIGCRRIGSIREPNDFKEQCFVQFFVSDNGHGISAKVLEHIFEPFYTTKRRGEGTGLGMALLHSFAMESQGKVEIDSTEGVGTTVLLFLPEASAELPTTIEEASVRPINRIDPEYTLLVVEDNPDVLRSTSDSLQLADFNVLEAIDGDSALDLVKRKHSEIDLICIDGVIPGASSAEVIQHVQTHFPEIKIVVCSGYIEEELILRGIRTGDLAFVRKPYLIDELLGCISSQLAVAKASRN